MREDAGLLKGAEALWQKGLLYDYTLKVQDQEIRVHKFILASVSDYFHAMLCGTMSESMNDSVELKEINAVLMSDLIKFIYTGDDSFISKSPKQMLELAVYFQMPKVIAQCQEQLMSKASYENYFDLLTTFEAFSLKEGVEEVTDFITENVHMDFKYYKLESITPTALGIILDAMDWMISDVHGFLYIIKWLDEDYDKRKDYANRFLSRIKYHLLPSEDITYIKEMDEYQRFHGAWKGPIEKLSAYHNLPGHQRIFNHSEKVKTEGKSLVAINAQENADGLSSFYVLHQIEDEVNPWQVCMPVESPQITGTVPFVIEVNNFLITCSAVGVNQKWQAFDPTTLTWFKMADMSRPRDMFAMVHHDRHLYVLGGIVGSSSQKLLTDAVEEYSFDTGTWSVTTRLPVRLRNHSACALDGCIYVSGGELNMEEGSALSDRLCCLNLSTRVWEIKAAMLRPTTHHKMCVMMIEEKETIVVIDREMRIQFYDPLSDQWSTCEFSVKKHNYEEVRAPDNTTAADCKNFKWGRGASRMFVDGNTIYFLNLTGLELDYYENKDDFKYVVVDTICVKWVVAEEKRDEIHEFTLPGFLNYYCKEEPRVNPRHIPPFTGIYTTPPMNGIYGLLAFPPEVLRYRKSLGYWD